jgi:hypothetical protein
MNQLQLNQKNLLAAIRDSSKVSYCNMDNADVALKIYFNPFSAIFFTEEEFDKNMEDDKITVKNPEWWIEETVKRLKAFGKEHLTKGEEIYLSIIVYGGGNVPDMCYHIDPAADDYNCEVIANEFVSRKTDTSVRKTLTDRFWELQETEFRAYSNRIDSLLGLLTDQQLEQVVDGMEDHD